MRTPPARPAAALAVIAVVGALLLAFADGRTGVEAAGMMVLGTALVLAVAGVFYLVGAAEDRDRDRS